MKSIGLALVLSTLTGAFVALDLSDVQAQIPQTPLSAPAEGLALMPNRMQGLAVPKADIRNGIFAVGSSTGDEGLNESTDGASDDEDDSNELPISPASSAHRNFVLI